MFSIVKGKLSLAPPKNKREKKIESQEEAGRTWANKPSIELQAESFGFFICSKEKFSVCCLDDEMIASRLDAMI